MNAVRAAPPTPPIGFAAHWDVGSAVLALDENGMIRDCSALAEELFGYRHGELAGRHIRVLLPQLADAELVSGDGVNPRLAFLCRCGTRFRGIRRNGESFACQLCIACPGNPGTRVLRVFVHAFEEALH